MPNNTKPDFDSGATNFRLFLTWIQTVLGLAAMGALLAGAVHLLGFHFGWGVALLSIMAVLPLLSWYCSAPLIKRLMRCVPPDPEDPDHMRLVRIVDNLFPKTGLPVKPPVMISPLPIANAFATGRSPRSSFIACTEGLFYAELTDEELEAVVAHELAHVKNRDTAITSLIAAMGSLFSLLLAAGIPSLFRANFISKTNAPLLNKLSRKVRQQRKRFFLPAGGFVGFAVMLVLFYIISIFTKLLTLFVARSRESAADVYAAQWTKNPCALSSALQKLVLFEEINGGNVSLMVLTRGLTPLLIVNAFGEDSHNDAPRGLLSRLRSWWQRLGQNHPPVEKRLKVLDSLSGGTCPRVTEDIWID
ncbi:MAG TPA: M48 family metalloprotease [Trichormus sp.]|jgi:heat shock protein HtpX